MIKMNFKKLLPGLTSIIIIVGMAIQSFATNVDMAAFVNKDKYMLKYYELDWRIDDIEAELERLYKFTCTNVRSYGGGTMWSSTGKAVFNFSNENSDYPWRLMPAADLSESKYLRVNTRAALQTFTHPANTHKWFVEYPANALKWNPKIVPAPNCKVRIDFSRTMPSTSTWNQTETNCNYTVTMGPFKKFPKFTSAGSRLDTGYLFEIDGVPSGTGWVPSSGLAYYAYGTETMPTSWTADSTLRLSTNYTVWVNPSNVANGLTQFSVEEQNERMKNNPYAKTSNFIKTYYSIYTLPTTDISKYENLWIRTTTDTNGALDTVKNSSFSECTLTTWNYNK